MTEPREGPPTIPGLRIGEVIGHGGFSTVYQAWQETIEREVAVKVLHGELDEGGIRQFLDEARTMGALSRQSHIATLYVAGRSDDGRPYLVMELYESSYLQRALSTTLPEAEVLQVGVKIGAAVDTAHLADIVHRDISPQNILLTGDGEPVLTDFGIALTRSGGEWGDQAGSEGGKIYFQAPEVLGGEAPSSVQSDIYSLGATLWMLLTGRSPFEGRYAEPSLEVMRRIIGGRIPEFPRTDVSRELVGILRRTLDRDPARRPRSAYELAEALRGLEVDLGHAPTELKPREGTDAPSGPTNTEPSPSRPTGGLDPDRTVVRPLARVQKAEEPGEPHKEAAGPRSKRPFAIAAAVAVLLVAGAGIGFAVSRQEVTPSPAATAPPVTAAPADAVGDPVRVPVVEQLVIEYTREGDVSISWALADPQGGEEILVRRVDPDHAWDEPLSFTEAPAVVSVEGDATPCFDVWVVAGTRLSETVTGCAS